MGNLTENQRRRLEEKRKSNRIFQLMFLFMVLVLLFFLIRSIFGKFFGKDNQTNQTINESIIETKEETTKEIISETKKETPNENVLETESEINTETIKENSISNIIKEIVNKEKKITKISDKYATTELSDREIEERITALPEILQEKIESYPESRNTILRYKESLENDLSRDISLDYENAKYIDRKVKLPYLNQWDERWGFDKVDGEFIAVSGCGPTTLSMIYSYFTGDTSMDPLIMAEYAYENGWYTADGGQYPLFTSGPNSLGLSGSEIDVSEDSLKNSLDDGNVIVALVLNNGIGDFTQGGHYIVITEYDENNQLTIYDVNSYKNTNQKWDMDRVFAQTKLFYEISN